MTTADLEVSAVVPHRQCSTLLVGSLSAPPVEEVEAGAQILASLEPRPRRLEIGSLPSCGRTEVDVHRLTEEVTAAFENFPHPLRVAAMGCVVNGPVEAREAALGVFSGNGRGQIFVSGEVVRAVLEHKIIEIPLDGALVLSARRAAEAGHSFRSGA